MNHHNTEVLLVNMPWGPVREPCLGLSILKTVLRTNGIPCTVLHAPMRLLRYVRGQTLDLIASTWAANEFAFTAEFEETPTAEQLSVLRKVTQDTQDCLAALPRGAASPDPFVEKIMRLRQEIVPRFLDDIMAEVDFSRYSLVGFSCLFDQTVASLALARRIKRNYPGILLAFGGYALQPPVGPALQRCFPEMDVVAYGDGEPVVIPLWEASCGMRPLADVPNISYRSGRAVVQTAVVPKIDLDDSPVPDYDDFFVQRQEMKEKYKVSFKSGEMHAESSRGCWYGQKAHCTFCGIDDETLRYRVKSPAVLLAQLEQLHKRYGVKVFRFADYIMPLQYYQSFLPEMARRGAPYQLHYETKANLKESQIEACARAGVRFLQPGIESFNTQALALMAKGVTAAQNAFTLYTAFRHGIYTYYNLIFGFPFEKPEDYAEMLQAMPALYHLIPPETTIPVLVTRYAPLATDPERFGAHGPLAAHWRYDVMFSREFRESRGLSTTDFCYYYETPYRQFSPELRLMFDVLQHQVAKWKERFEARNARLIYRDEPGGLTVLDSRYGEDPRIYTFAGVHGEIGAVLRAGFLSEPRLISQMEARGCAAQDTQKALQELIDSRVVIRLDRQLIWLALPEGAWERTLQDWTRDNLAVRDSSEWGEWETESTRHTSRAQPLTVLTTAV